MKQEDISRLLAVSCALTAERDKEALLSSILDTAIELARCDAGTLYLLEDNALRFVRMVTLSRNIRQGGHADPITLPPVPMEDPYVCSFAALHRRVVNIADVRHCPDFDFSGSLKYDAMTGYSTVSMLVVPMTGDRGEIIGVMQLINAMDAGKIIPFPKDLEQMISALASQAAACIINMNYAEQVNALLDSLVEALITAIDARTPYNANHSRNMAAYASAFLDWLDETNSPYRFDPDRRRAFLLSVLLHDVGKLVIPLSVMDKASRLGGRISAIEERFRRFDLQDRIALLEGRISPDDYEAERADRKEALEKIHALDCAESLEDKDFRAVRAMAARTCRDENGNEEPWLTEYELECLTIPNGTITEKERSIMNSHATKTAEILSQVAFPAQYASTPVWAAAHHEFLDGSGYPAHLTAKDIPAEVRLMTILDIFDSQTAMDRPYKKPKPAEVSLKILHGMANRGQLDKEILELFEKSRVWEKTARPA